MEELFHLKLHKPEFGARIKALSCHIPSGIYSALAAYPDFHTELR